MLQELRSALVDDVERCWVLPCLDGPAVDLWAAASWRSCRVLPSDVLRRVLGAGWSRFVLVHTHPRGGPPGPADHAVTRRLVAACQVVGVELDAHLLLAPEGTYVVSGSRGAGIRGSHAA